MVSFRKYFKGGKPAQASSTPVTAVAEEISLEDSQTSSVKPSNDNVKHDVMASYLYHQQGNNGWRTDDYDQQGVMLRSTRDTYLTFPPMLAESDLVHSLKRLNVQAAMTVNSPVIRSFLQGRPDSMDIRKSSLNHGRSDKANFIV